MSHPKCFYLAFLILVGCSLSLLWPVVGTEQQCFFYSLDQSLPASYSVPDFIICSMAKPEILNETHRGLKFIHNSSSYLCMLNMWLMLLFSERRNFLVVCCWDLSVYFKGAPERQGQGGRVFHHHFTPQLSVMAGVVPRWCQAQGASSKFSMSMTGVLFTGHW